MTEDKIAALDLKQLRALLDNARRMTGEKAAHVASLAAAELARREAKKPSRPKPTSNWTKHGGTYAHAGDLYEYRVGDMVVATIRKLTNHSTSEDRVYEATVRGQVLGTYGKIDTAKDAVELALEQPA
jgi:hypothetical protein